MAVDALDRRMFALDAKVASLTDEIATWKGMPEKPTFAIHASQIEEVCGTLAAMIAMIQSKGSEIKSLADVEALEQQILAALHIWDCYRSKWVLRLIDSLAVPLALMDDLAWHAYWPARDRAVASGSVSALDVREPPLVFPNPVWSPFARSREQAYELDETTGDLRAYGAFDRWLREIPVPLIGVPWYQLTHLPEAVFIGHEVGHLVEDDLGLEDSLRAVIGQALPERCDEQRAAWTRHWRSEVFADVYGVLVTGPAYAAVLLDLLDGDPQLISVEAQPNNTPLQSEMWRAYPTRALRALIVCEAVRQLPVKPGEEDPDRDIFRQAAARLQATWTSTHPKHAMADYEGDVAAVVGAILHSPLPAFHTDKAPGGAALSTVLRFTPAMETKAMRDASEANRNMPVTADDIRTLFAGVARAFITDAKSFLAAGAQARFRRQLELRRTRGPRSVAVPGFRPANPDERRAAHAQALADMVARSSR